MAAFYRIGYRLIIWSINYPIALKTNIYIKTFTWKFIAFLFIISQSWKQLRCPSILEWINRVWFMHIIEYYLDKKRNELIIHVTTWWVLDAFCLVKETRLTCYILYDLIHMTFWKMQKTDYGLPEIGKDNNLMRGNTGDILVLWN